MAEGQSKSTVQQPQTARSSAPPAAGQDKADWASLDRITEGILRRIMRVACVVGSLGIASAFVSPQPYNAAAMLVSVAATSVIFGVTFLPIRMRVLSVFYPWALVLVGGANIFLMGPRADAMLLLAGALFVGSLVLRALGITLLSLGTAGALVAAAYSQTPFADATLELWTGSVSAMLAVIIPAAVAGRMLVGALARALADKHQLFDKVVEERHALQEAIATLEATRTQLTHAQKLELISQMAGGIAHDMNNALTSVVGEASLLDSNVAEQRERIVESALYAAQLTQQLMVLGRRDASQPRPINLTLAMRGLVRSGRRLLPSDITMDLQLPEEEVPIHADPTHLLQILLNLAGNAKDAMPHGGSLTISLLKEQQNGQAVLTVEDTGTGMTPDTLSKIFDPFFTTKPPGKGTGLGLANVQQLVEQMGGEITVDSRLGEGTRFELRLPLTDEPVASESADVVSSSHRSGTVLIVDDDVRVRAVVYSALQHVGYRVLEAPNLDVAMGLFRANGGRVDLLITDVVMPGAGGADAIQRFRKEAPRLPVLVISGYADDEALARGITEGQYPFLPKPFTADTLTEAVDRAMAGASAD